MMVLWWGDLGNPPSSTPQDQAADQQDQAGADAAAEMPVKRPSVSVPGVRRRVQDLASQLNPKTLHDEVMSAPLQHTRRIRKPPVMTESDRQICDFVVRLRREWQLSQTQFARVCNVRLRTVKGWEAHRCKPMARTRALIGSLVHYVEVNGLAAFYEHYVREEPRYRKSGPAHLLAENPFDSRIVGASPSAFVVSNLGR